MLTLTGDKLSFIKNLKNYKCESTSFDKPYKYFNDET